MLVNVNDPILGSTYKVIQSAETLTRLYELNDSLNPSKIIRKKAIEALRCLGTEVTSNATSLEDRKIALKVGLSEIKAGVKQNKNLLNIYERIINAAKTSEELEKCLKKFVKDADSLPTFLMQKTKNGQNGPTCLVSYMRSNIKLRNYVVKWSNWDEVSSSRVYEAFSQNLKDQPFIIPKTSALDFEKCIHENSDWMCNHFEEDLNQTFQKCMGKSIQKNDVQIMLMEKVKGSNLIDFAENKYEYLAENEKWDLFQKMGQLAMFDLVIGNRDRLIQTEVDANSNQYQLKPLTANLANLMIEWFPDNGQMPKLYAIDNGITMDLAYNEFIQAQWNDSDALANAIICSIKKSLLDISERLTEHSKLTLNEALAKFEALSNDLDSENTKNALKNGLEEMSLKFNNALISSWDNEKLKNYLSFQNPALQDVLNKRFQIFEKDYNMNNAAALGSLIAIESHAKEGSLESREAVLNIVDELLESGILSDEFRVGVENIKERAKAEKWDPSVSPNATKLIKKICSTYDISHKPNCAKKLF